MSTALVEIVTTAVQELVEAELTALIGAEPGERTEARTNQRNGHRPKLVSTPAGDLELKIPKLRQRSFFPELLEPDGIDLAREMAQHQDGRATTRGRCRCA